jgi:hypothetical protein
MIRSYATSRPKPKLWVEILITVLGIIGVVVFFALHVTAFPDASVDVSISRAQAKQIAMKQLTQLGYSMDGYQFALSFSSDSSAAYYLQRTLGIQESNMRLTSEHWPLYYWSARWFKPLQKEEFYVYLMPDGKLLGLNHIIKEDTPGTNVSQAKAEQIAKSFLAQHTNWQAADWERVEAASEAKPAGRVDHSFTWKSKHFSAGASELRYLVTVQGDQIGLVYDYIKVPEAFTRQYASERDVAWFISNIAYIVIVLGSAIIAMLAIVLSRPDFRRALVPALLVAGVTLAAGLNSIPLYKSYYGTTENYSLFWVRGAIDGLFAILFVALQVALLFLGAQSLSRFVWHRQDRILARGPEPWIDFSRSAWRGLMIAGIDMAYAVLFYTFTKNYLHWWSPATTQYSDIFATPFPFFYAFEVGLSAALIEELSIRFIGITFFLWLFRGKYKWLAVLLPSLFWAFAHTGYMTYPIYARGVELTISALFWGFIFLKFDLLTTIMSHFTYNMMVTGIVLLRSSERYYQLSGWVVILTLLLPLLPGLYLTLRRRVRHESRAPESLTISFFDRTDIEQLSRLPVKANWQALAAQPNRTIFCLHANHEIVGFITGFIDEDQIGHIDGVYVSPKWRRQYWGAILLDEMHQHLKSCGSSEIRIQVKPNENRARSFLHNLFWKTSLHILTRNEAQQTFRTALQDLFKDLRKERVTEYELEISRGGM